MLGKRAKVTLDTSSNSLSLDLQRFTPETVLRHSLHWIDIRHICLTNLKMIDRDQRHAQSGTFLSKP